ncbi:MAG: thymidylate kinase [Gracilibacter sp. BRH_c7a]|nr:MAG: thymidylate kinase [Gracilibacter sp. BRH_c7a]
MQSQQNKGKFIVLEGIDGSGISTQILELKRILESEYDLQTILTKEPSTGPVGVIIRQVLSGRLSGLEDSCLALLFAADRVDHNRNVIIPALQQGKHVICDRYLWSSLAYQGRKEDTEWLEEINKYAYKPDLTFFIRVRPEISLKRITSSRLSTEIFEELNILRQVYNNYIKIFKKWQDLGEQVIEIDGELSPEAVTAEIKKELQNYFLAENKKTN